MDNTTAEDSGKIIVYVDADIEDLVPGFLERRHLDIGLMLDALAIEDYETVRDLGHSIKGVGGFYGFDRITEIGQALEEAAISRDSDRDSESIRAPLR